MYYILFCICNWPSVFTRMTRNGLFFYKCMDVRMSLFNLILKHPHCDCCWWMYTSRCFSWFLIYGLDAGEMEWDILQTSSSTIITISLSIHSSLGVKISEYQCWNIYKYAMCTSSILCRYNIVDAININNWYLCSEI